VAGCCEPGNEPADSIKTGNILNAELLLTSEVGLSFKGWVSLAS
jgi:hypothetical protein